MKKFIAMNLFLFAVNVVVASRPSLRRDVRSVEDIQRVREFNLVLASIKTVQRQDALGRIAGYESWIWNKKTKAYESFVRTSCQPQQTNIPMRLRS